MGGMGQEEVYTVTLMQEQAAAEAVAEDTEGGVEQEYEAPLEAHRAQESGPDEAVGDFDDVFALWG
eukprot:5288623-Alexandrium_andersonii.AAC.1